MRQYRNKGFLRESVVLILSGNTYSENFVNDNQKSPTLIQKAGKLNKTRQTTKPGGNTGSQSIRVLEVLEWRHPLASFATFD